MAVHIKRQGAWRLGGDDKLSLRKRRLAVVLGEGSTNLMEVLGVGCLPRPAAKLVKDDEGGDYVSSRWLQVR